MMKRVIFADVSLARHPHLEGVFHLHFQFLAYREQLGQDTRKLAVGALPSFMSTCDIRVIKRSGS